MDPYKILELEPGADEETIKKQYKKLALRYHPDKANGDSEKFKEINEAYQKLTKCPEDSMGNLFEELMRQMGQMGGAFGRPKGPVVQAILNVTLEQVYVGGTHRVNYQIKKPNGVVKQVVVTRQMGPIAFQEVHMVPEFDTIDAQCDIEISPGMDTNIPIMIEKDDYTLSVQIHAEKHTTFQRVGNDLMMTLTVSLGEALTGFRREILHLSGTNLDIVCQTVVSPNTIKEIKGEGMSSKGSLFIRFNVEFPKDIPEEQKDVLSKIGSLFI